jgi:hypothetical protein
MSAQTFTEYLSGAGSLLTGAGSLLTGRGALNPIGSKLRLLVAAALIGLVSTGCLAESDEDYDDEQVGQVEEPFVLGATKKKAFDLDSIDEEDEEGRADGTPDGEPDPEPWHGELNGFEPAPAPGNGSEENSGNEP